MRLNIRFSFARLGILLTCFAVGAVGGYVLQGRLTAVRLFCMPMEAADVSALAVELALWLGASLTLCAVPLFAGLTLYRGFCFGMTAALLTAGTLTAPTLVPLYTYAAVTLLLCLYAAGARPDKHAILRFLPYAGMAMGQFRIQN